MQYLDVEQTPAAEFGQPYHGEHDAIFCLNTWCRHCSKEGVGTCFLLADLNEPAIHSGHFHFATAAHALYCKGCYRYRRVKLKNQLESMLPGLGWWKPSKTDDKYGWAQVPDYYERWGAPIYDYGVMGVKKAKLLRNFGDRMEAAEANMIRVNPESTADFYSRGFLCGYYPNGLLYCTGNGKAARDPRQYATNFNTEQRRRELERGAAGLYLTKQDHFGDGADGMRWKAPDSPYGNRVLRYYLPSTEGQSGGPIRLESGEAVGIHSGYRESPNDGIDGQRHGYNSGVHLLANGVLSMMKEWVVEPRKQSRDGAFLASLNRTLEPYRPSAREEKENQNGPPEDAWYKSVISSVLSDESGTTESENEHRSLQDSGYESYDDEQDEGKQIKMNIINSRWRRSRQGISDSDDSRHTSDDDEQDERKQIKMNNSRRTRSRQGISDSDDSRHTSDDDEEEGSSSR